MYIKDDLVSIFVYVSNRWSIRIFIRINPFLYLFIRW